MSAARRVYDKYAVVFADQKRKQRVARDRFAEYTEAARRVVLKLRDRVFRFSAVGVSFNGLFFPVSMDFLFIAGSFMYELLKTKNKLYIFQKGGVKPLEWLGRHSLTIYLVHQPAVYFVFWILNKLHIFGN